MRTVSECPSWLGLGLGLRLGLGLGLRLRLRLRLRLGLGLGLGLGISYYPCAPPAASRLPEARSALVTRAASAWGDAGEMWRRHGGDIRAEVREM